MAGTEVSKNREGDGALVIDKGLEGNRKLGVGLFKDRGSNVREADMDEGFVRVRGMRLAGGRRTFWKQRRGEEGPSERRPPRRPRLWALWSQIGGSPGL